MDMPRIRPPRSSAAQDEVKFRRRRARMLALLKRDRASWTCAESQFRIDELYDSETGLPAR